MSKKNPDYKLLKVGRGLVRGLDAAFDAAMERNEVPIEALQRLVTPKAETTWNEIAKRILSDWQAEQPRIIKPAPSPTALAELNDGSPYRNAAVNGANTNIVVVPDIAAVELTALVEKELNLTYLDSDYKRWDYYTDLKGKPIRGRGLKFEVAIYKPELGRDQSISSEAVRAYFRKLGFTGHVGAFTEWRRSCGLDGYHTSIPEDDCCSRGALGYLYVPYSYFGSGDRKLYQRRLLRVWIDRWSFVGFREVAS